MKRKENSIIDKRKKAEELFEMYLEKRVVEKDFSSIHLARHFFDKNRNNFVDFAEFIINYKKLNKKKEQNDNIKNI